MPSYPKLLSDDDVAAMIAPTPFGLGTSRHVYDVPSDPDVVVKRSLRPRNWGNIMEWTLWLGAEHVPSLASLLARCHCLSETGLFLVMERLDDLSPDDFAAMPDVPIWLDDKKPDTFGKRDGAIKVRDYGVVKFDTLLNAATTSPPAWAVNARAEAMLKRMDDK